MVTESEVTRRTASRPAGGSGGAGEEKRNC